MTLPNCGLYRTSIAIEGIAAGSLVYFHNHGDPGAGVYAPTSWKHNRAVFSSKGTTLPDASLAATLEPLPVEGFYRVLEDFTCCDKACRTYAVETLVQLGYNGKGEGILFLPTQSSSGLSLPERGTRIENDRFSKIQLLKVAKEQSESTATPSQVH